MVDLSNITYRFWNERDLEIPAVIDFVKSHPDIKTLLDVGSHYSSHYYASSLRPLLTHYAGVDILPDPETEKILDRYVVGNVLDDKIKPGYDAVISVSSIEHSGISTYKVADYKEEQRKVFKRIVEIAKKYVFLTFPFGAEAVHENEFANITFKQLLKFKETYTGETEQHFYFSESPFVDHIPYEEVSIDKASSIIYKPELGTRCVCFLTIEKY